MRQVEFGRSPDNEIKTVTPTSNTSYKFSLEISEEDSNKVTIRNKILRKQNNNSHIHQHQTSFIICVVHLENKEKMKNNTKHGIKRIFTQNRLNAKTCNFACVGLPLQLVTRCYCIPLLQLPCYCALDTLINPLIMGSLAAFFFAAIQRKTVTTQFHIKCLGHLFCCLRRLC